MFLGVTYSVSQTVYNYLFILEARVIYESQNHRIIEMTGDHLVGSMFVPNKDGNTTYDRFQFKDSPQSTRLDSDLLSAILNYKDENNIE